MRKYLKFFTTFVSIDLIYRTEFIGFVFTWVLSTLCFVLLWTAVYREGNVVGSYSLENVVSYYFFILVVSFLTETYIGADLATKIRKGLISNDFLRPFHIWLQELTRAFAGKIMPLLIPFPIYVFIVIILLPLLLPDATLSWPAWQQIGATILISIGALCLNFILEYITAGFAFWAEDTWAFAHLKHILITVLGGVTFPIDFLSGTVRDVFEFLPFKYIYYVPVSYLNGRFNLDQLPIDLLTLSLWIVFFAALSNIFWHFGRKRYDAFGN